MTCKAGMKYGYARVSTDGQRPNEIAANGTLRPPLCTLAEGIRRIDALCAAFMGQAVSAAEARLVRPDSTSRDVLVSAEPRSLFLPMNREFGNRRNETIFGRFAAGLGNIS